MVGDHIFITEMESVTDGDADMDIKWRVDAKDLMLDLKVLIKEYYLALIDLQKNSLRIKFNNGQEFDIHIEEKK